MKEPELEEEQLSLVGVGDDLLIRRRTMQEAPGPVALTAPSGETSETALAETAPGRFETRIAGAERGLYRARAGELFAVGAVGLAAAPEFENVVSSTMKLAPAVGATKGGAYEIRRGNGLALPAVRRVRESAGAYAGPGWAGIIGRNASRLDAVRDAPLAPPYLWLAFIAFALAGAWWVEGRGGGKPK